jgi:predicted MFS family arabinose efflux permease
LPLWGYRRKSYLLISSGVTMFSLIALSMIDLPFGAEGWLLALLLPVSLAIAFSDVVVDGLMVERGQPLGITGRLQSIQWTMIWGASIFTGVVGGHLSGSGNQQTAFLLCGLVTAVTFFSSLWLVEERRSCDAAGMRRTLGDLWRSTHSPALLAAAAFLFLWNFNPFSTSVLYVHMTRGLGFSEELVGQVKSVLAVASMLASGAYGFYCRRVPMWLLIHLCIVLGIVSNLMYWTMHDERSAYLVAFAFGTINATAIMVQLDLAARRCPPVVAGTMFALLMSLSNFGTSLSGWLGGYWYDDWTTRWGAVSAFDWLVGVGAVFTAGCWLLAPWLNRGVPGDD